jgi:NAD(P)H dehydrogenase (quinone)
MYIVTGATGHTGSQIVKKLITLVPASKVGVSVRDPQKARDLEAAGVRVRRGDFAEPDSLRHAFEGATQVLIVSTNGGDAEGQHRNAIEAARAAGAQRILYTSHMGVRATSPYLPMRFHAATEELLSGCGVRWISLRNGFYSESALFALGEALTTGVIELPADGKVNWTARADLAEANAIILADEQYPVGPTAPLTSPEVLDFSDIAKIASDLLGRPVTRSVPSDAELRTKMGARRIPDAYVDILFGMFEATRDGNFAAIDPTLTQLLGRPPTTMRSFLAQTLKG